MAWTVELSESSVRQLRKMDRSAASRITGYLHQVAVLDDPRARGKPLTGRLAGLWRYRIGDYCVIADIHDARMVIVAVRISHRSGVYDD